MILKTSILILFKECDNNEKRDMTIPQLKKRLKEMEHKAKITLHRMRLEFYKLFWEY